LDILDTAGQEEYSAMRDQYMRTGEIFLVVYAITSRASFDELVPFMAQIAAVKDCDHVPMILAGNKSDLADERQVTTEEAKAFADSKGVFSFLETSALTRTNVEQLFFDAVRAYRSTVHTQSHVYCGKRPMSPKGLTSKGCTLF